MKINKTLKISRRNFTSLVYALVILIVAPLILATSNNKTKVAKAAWYSDSAWQYRQKVTIDHTKVAADQSNFPVLIKITNQYNQIFSSAKDDGTDILFTDSNGTKISYEIETFSKSAKELWAWVKAPTLSSATDTNFYMYYGNAAAADQQNKTDVWSSRASSVHHMGSPSSLSIIDSVGANNGTSTNVTAAQGRINGAGSFNGVSSFANIGKLGDFGSSRGQGYYMSSWVYSNSTAAISVITGTQSDANGKNGLSLSYNAWSDNTLAGESVRTALLSNEASAKLLIGATNTNDITTLRWHYVVVGVVPSTNTVSISIDGISKSVTYNSQQTPALFANFPNDVYIGAQNGSVSPRYANAYIDEVRYSLGVIPSGMVTTEYNNQNDPGSFASISYEMNQNNYQIVSEKEWTGSSWLYKQKLQILNNTASPLTDYQVAIDSSNISLTNVFAKSKSDGSDIRFSNAGSSAELPYFVQSYVPAGSAAKIWVKIPYIPASSSTYIYLYYGNPAATSASSSDSVFPAYDDFSEASINPRWTTLSGTGSVTQSGGAINFSYLGSDNADWWTSRPQKVLKLNTLPVGDFEASVKLNTYTPGAYSHAGIAVYGADNSAYMWGRYYNGGINNFQLEKGGVGGIATYASTTLPQYLAIRRIGSSYSFWISADRASWTKVGVNYSDVTFNNIVLFGKEWNAYSLDFSEDDFMIRAYAATDPTISLSGSEICFDLEAPTNPTVFTAKNVQGGAITLSNESYYNYATPYFSWPTAGSVGGANDFGSGVVGYYAYFGTSCGDSGANPATSRGVLPDLGSGVNYSVNTAFSIPDLGANYGNYCLRVKTKDLAGNMSETTEAFIYKYETSLPNKPSYVAVTPAGYSSVNSFTFSWPVASDTDSTPQSGLAGYQYKTGADASEWSETQIGTSVNGIQSYQSGSNVFLVRSIDAAGNFSPTVQSTYYFSSNPPSKPTSLTATPDISSSNLFSFSWSAPVHDVPIINYGYSVNAYPTVNNIIWTNSTSLSLADDSYATIQGVNTIYLLAKDETGVYSLDQTSVASADFNCTTSSPSIPLQVSISDSSNRAADLWALTVKWSAGLNQESSSFDHYTIYRSTDNLDFIEIATTRSTAYIDSSNLVNTTKYYYKIKAVDNATAKSAYSEVVYKTPTGRYDVAPTITAQPEISTKASNATFTWESDRSSSSFVRYGTDIGNLSESKGQYDLVTNHSVYISGLQASTKYYYQVQSVDEFRDYTLDSAYSIMYSFTTLSAPAFQNVVSSDLSLFGATVNFETTSPSQISLKYGTSINYGTTMEGESNSLTTKHTMKISDLSPGTTYHFKLSGFDIDGNALISDDYVFATLPMPVVLNLGYQPDYAGPTPGIKITWKTNVPTSSSVEYVPKLGSIFEESSKSALTLDHEIILVNLKDNTTYSFNVYGADQFGNIARSDSNVLNTPNDTRPPMIADVSIESQNNNDTSQSSAQIAIAFKTDEISSVQIEYGEGVGGDNYTSKTQEDAPQTINHLVIISNLDASKTYHLRIVARDTAQNVSYSDDNVVITKKAQASPFNTILKALTRAFSWINWFK